MARGLTGVQLVISGSHQGLEVAIATAGHGATWRRCRVHFIRNVLGLVSKSAQEMVAATIRTAFAQPDPSSARETRRKLANGLRGRFPRVGELLDEAETNVLACLAFPRGHWCQIWSNNSIERLNKEKKRQTDLVGTFPCGAAVRRLVGAELA